MPNHVMNRIFFNCDAERAKEIMSAVMCDPNPDDEEGTGYGTFDFNKLIPMPPALMIEAGSSTEQGIEIYLTAVNPDTPDYDLPKMQKDKFEKLLRDLNGERRFTTYKGSLSEEEIQRYTKYTKQVNSTASFLSQTMIPPNGSKAADRCRFSICSKKAQKY